MSPWVIKRIRENPLLYRILREESYHYKYLFKDERYIFELEKIAKEKYKMRLVDRLDRLEKKLGLIQTLISVMD